MFCKNCGAQMQENEKFCHKCGNANDAVKRNSFSVAVDELAKKNKRIIVSIFVVILLSVIIAVGVNMNKPEKKVLGTWKISEYSDQNRDYDDSYPESDYITFLENGMGYFGNDTDDTFMYHINGDTLTIDSENLVHAYNYIFEVKRDTLTLRYLGQAPITYDKVKQSDIADSDDDCIYNDML